MREEAISHFWKSIFDNHNQLLLHIAIGCSDESMLKTLHNVYHTPYKISDKQNPLQSK